MFLNRSRIGTTTLSIAMLASLITGYPSTVHAQSYQPSSDIGLPGRREGGGTRGSCASSAHQLTAIAPEQNFGYTTDPFPTLHWYVPELANQTAEFILYTEDATEIYSTSFVIDGAEGIISLSLPKHANLPPLELGQKYRWQFSIICQDSATAIPSVTFAEGWIERTELDAALTAQLEQASDLEKVTLLAENGIWFDAVNILAKLRRGNMSPSIGSASVEQAWQNLLGSVNLTDIADAAMQPCCDDPSVSSEAGDAPDAADATEPNASNPVPNDPADLVPQTDGASQ